jgi:phosphoribosylformylglycinamidine cyclo-ligase
LCIAATVRVAHDVFFSDNYSFMPAKMPAKKSKKAYAKAGVDIDLGNQVKETLPAMLASTHRREVLGKVGGFGGLFALNTKELKQPVLVSSVDGVGTKLKVAFAMKRHDTIGQDLVNHCVNDIAVLGAEPLFFLDYLGAGELKPKVFEEIVRGFAIGCRENGCSLIGGETAQMPGFYQKGEYDVSGTIVGVVDKPRMIDGSTIKPGDVLIGLASNGLHTNGYSLARQVFFEKMKLRPRQRVAELGGTVGGELLRTHRSYWPVVSKLLKKLNPAGKPKALKGMAHITGGGFVDNLPRVLPAKCDAVIEKGTWDVSPGFQLIGEHGKVPEAEMYQVFNMGVGMALVVSAAREKEAMAVIRRAKFEANVIGRIEKGNGVARIV